MPSIPNMSNLLNDLNIDNATSFLPVTFRNIVAPFLGTETELPMGPYVDFNALNLVFRLDHMARNKIEKDLTLSAIGGNAYADGDGDNTSIPVLMPSYAKGFNYGDFVIRERGASKSGALSTRDKRYWDLPENFSDSENTGVNGVIFSNDEWVNRNSILAKTRNLWNQNKIKSIISEFHTTGVQYEGQVATQFGESRGRNLLTYAVENGGSPYTINGYDNPYCRVWTNHHRYAKFLNTMRANSGELNYWGDNFEIDPENVTEYGDGENYDYAWRGKHNQDRRARYSVLDTETGLVKIAPKFMGGGASNIHTKSCMFSIENLAWKDYDPYSFEQSLSWEQRGPLGGRIMWFPPYGITITEATSANWNGQDFIGRGEKVYTYVNTERSGTLNFIMLTDHPSSVDYASWYNDAGLNTENDYHRYFAGCNDGKPADGQVADFSGNLSGSRNTGKMNNDMLIKKPTLLTDEYNDEKANIVNIVAEEEPPYVPPPPNIPEPVDTDIQFLVFFPNNYSGYYDQPTNTKAGVDAITYLLAGVGAQVSSGKQTVGKMIDIPISETNLGSNPIGYEMGNTGISVDDLTNRIRTHTKGSYPKWQYRIDAKRNSKNEILYASDGNNNMAVDVLRSASNYKDAHSFQFNNFDINNVGDDLKAFGSADIDLYSFAEVAAAIYEESTPMHTYLMSKGVNEERVKKLKEIFATELTGIDVAGYSNSHGNVPHNKQLATNRGNTVLAWLRKYLNVPDNVNVTTESTDSVKVDSPSVDSRMPKLYRSAKVVLHFRNSQTVSENQTNPKNGFVFLNYTEEEGGGVPEFDDTNAYRKISDEPENYEVVTSKPDDWDTNFIAYYKKIYVGDTEGVEISDYKVHEEPESTYKNYVGFEWVKNKANTDGTIWNYYRLKQENIYFEEVKDPNEDEEEKKTKDSPVTLSETQIFNMLTSFIKTDNPSKFYYKANQTFRKIELNEANKYLKPGFNIIEVMQDADGDVSPTVFEINDFLVLNTPIDIDDNMLVVTKDFNTLEAEHTIEYLPYPTEEEEDKATRFNITYRYRQDDIFYTDDNGSGNHHDFYKVLSGFLANETMTRKATTDDFENGDSDPYNPDTHYSVDTIIYKNDDVMSNRGFYICVDEAMTHNMSWLGTKLIDKSMEVLGYSETDFIDKLKQKVPLDSFEGCADEVILDRNAGDLDVIWEYVDMKEYDSTKVTTSTALETMATEVAGKIDSNETTFISTMLRNSTDHRLTTFGNQDVHVIINTEDVKKYIGAKRLLDIAEFVDMEDGTTRNVETGETDTYSDMIEKSLKKDAKDCDTTLWVDRGDGILVQECYLGTDNRKGSTTSRENDGNKVRYDQEYYFYKRYMADHPLVFEKLQEKVKYFEPAFHSMTPEGFNARLTFLEQCTRQGNTKTMSDQGGKTANNLAFGRPPFCVLRLGDFYNQLIVIESISKDYSVSDGLQWDLNTEGNGVQPMLCKVTINFKFIGGGDITGPVRRLQNAMSFNYYANTSFYDNRADRVEYQPTNYETMGGAGNNQLDFEKSYAYTGKMYDGNPNQREVRIKNKNTQ